MKSFQISFKIFLTLTSFGGFSKILRGFLHDLGRFSKTLGLLCLSLSQIIIFFLLLLPGAVSMAISTEDYLILIQVAYEIQFETRSVSRWNGDHWSNPAGNGDEVARCWNLFLFDFIRCMCFSFIFFFLQLFSFGWLGGGRGEGGVWSLQCVYQHYS